MAQVKKNILRTHGSSELSDLPEPNSSAPRKAMAVSREDVEAMLRVQSEKFDTFLKARDATIEDLRKEIDLKEMSVKNATEAFARIERGLQERISQLEGKLEERTSMTGANERRTLRAENGRRSKAHDCSKEEDRRT